MAGARLEVDERVKAHDDGTPARLRDHLRNWLGAWPEEAAAFPAGGLIVVASPTRDLPGWDGQREPALGVRDPSGRGVVSVAPAYAAAIAALAEAGDAAPSRLGAGDAAPSRLVAGDAAPWRLVAARLPALVGRPDHRWYTGIMRWSVDPAPLPDAGDWEAADADGLPAWLRPFGGEVLVARDSDGGYLAGVGLKRHDAAGIELAVGTEPVARGRGLARRLVAQAGRRVLAAGAIPTYLHDPANEASARAAEAAGFPDRGWRISALIKS